MDWQFVIIALAVAGAVAYLGRAAWKTWTGAKVGCSSGCGKCRESAAPREPANRISLPQV